MSRITTIRCLQASSIRRQSAGRCMKTQALAQGDKVQNLFSLPPFHSSDGVYLPDSVQCALACPDFSDACPATWGHKAKLL